LISVAKGYRLQQQRPDTSTHMRLTRSEKPF
jgi:hypothetical protein